MAKLRTEQSAPDETASPRPGAAGRNRREAPAFRERLVYGVSVGNHWDYEGPAMVEAVFTTEAAAIEYARRRSADKYGNFGGVTRWELDNPDRWRWVVDYQNGEQRCRNDRPEESPE